MPHTTKKRQKSMGAGLGKARRDNPIQGDERKMSDAQLLESARRSAEAWEKRKARDLSH